MKRSKEDVQYYRAMECVVSKTITRLMEAVLVERPTNSKGVLQVAMEAAKKDLKKTKGWWCGLCAAPNDAESHACGSCAMAKDGVIPVGDGAEAHASLLLSLRHELQKRDQRLTEREEAVAAKEKELGLTPADAAGATGGGKAAAVAETPTPSRFGDGANIAPSQDRVPEIPMLLPRGYLPPKSVASPDGRAVLQHIATWYDPKNAHHWQKSTIDDFVSDSDFLVDCEKARGRQGTEAAMSVRTLYAYTHSQLAPRLLWAMWVPEAFNPENEEHTPPKWEPLFATGEQLEAKYRRGEAGAALTLAYTKEAGRLLGKEEQEWTDVELTSAAQYESLGLAVFTLSRGHVVVRFENSLRGSREFSPLRDTVSWLPSGDVLVGGIDGSPVLSEEPGKAVIPLAGVLEFIAANPADRVTDGGKDSGWVCRPYVDGALAQLVQECMDQPNQQKASKKLHEKAAALLKRTSIPKQEGFPAISPELIAKVVKYSTGWQEGVMLTPEEIARALTMQCLTWNQQHYVLTLSTTTVETRTPHTLGSLETGRVLPMYRTVAAFWPQQIFFLLNMAMRESQFGNSAAELVINETDLTRSQGTHGKYYSPQPTNHPTDDGRVMTESTPVFNKRDRGLFGTLNKVAAHWDIKTKHWCVEFPTGNVERIPEADAWVAMKAWMLPQTRPLIFFTNKALTSVHRLSAKAADQKTYRGIRCALSRDVYAAGNVLVWSQYSSTSEDQGVAAAFAKGDSPAAVFTLHGKSKCVLLSPYSRFAREAELLYMNNTCFRVTESLTQEQAQILGKENLQLFTLQEIEDIDMFCILVRRTLPFAKTTAAASVVFQAERALRTHRNLDLSISHAEDGSVPEKWQVFITSLSPYCPFDGSTAWSNPPCSAELVDLLNDVHTSLPRVVAGELPSHQLYLRSHPDGRPATYGLAAVKLNSHHMTAALGVYKRDMDDTDLVFECGQNDMKVEWAEGKWKMAYEADDMDEEIEFMSDVLLGDWPKVGKRDGPQIKPVQYKSENILAPRCNDNHLLVQTATSLRREVCELCDKEIVGMHYSCPKCDYRVDLACVNSLEFNDSCGDDIKFTVESNTLVRYVNGQVECPQISRLEYRSEELVDQRGVAAEFDSDLALRLARLAAVAIVPNNIPLTLEGAHPWEEGGVLDAAARLLGEDVHTTSTRIFGAEEGNNMFLVKIGGHLKGDANKTWLCDAQLRRTEARPGLAVGDEGAAMAATIIKLGVPLNSVGLRNNMVTLDGVKLLLEAVKMNPHLQEIALDGASTAMQDPNCDLEVYRQAISVRCMYHRCVNTNENLTDDHLAGMGERWPEVFALALGDLPNVKLPVAGILDQYPQGWRRMCRMFKHCPKTTDNVLHNACRRGNVRAVVPLLDNCGVDPDTRDNKNNPALLLAVRQPSFESDVGQAAIRRLVIDPSSELSKLALKSAALCCGPLVTGALLDAGVVPDAGENATEVLSTAVVNNKFGTDVGTAVLRRLITPEALEEGDQLLKACAVKVPSFPIIAELLSHKVAIAKTGSENRTALHLMVSRIWAEPGSGQEDGACAADEPLSPSRAASSAPAPACDLSVLKGLISEDVLDTRDESDRTPLTSACSYSPFICSFLLDNGVKPGDEDLAAASKNKLFNSTDGTTLSILRRLCLKTPEELGVMAEKEKENDSSCASLDDSFEVPVKSLLTALENGYEHIARYLMHDLKIDCTRILPKEEEGPLHYCCKGSVDWLHPDRPVHSAVFADLVAKLPNTDAVGGDDDMTPFAYAVLQNHVHTAAHLLDLGANVTIEVQSLPMSFHMARSELATSEKGLEIMEKVFNAPEIVNATCEMEATPLTIACYFGRVESAEFLLNRGADPDAFVGEDGDEGSALALACQHKAFADRMDVFTRLITEKSINGGEDCDDESRPISVAIIKGNLKVIPVLLERGADNLEMYVRGMCESDEFDSPDGVELVKALLTQERLNKKDEDDNTYLYHAVSAGNVSVANLLLDEGADPMLATADFKKENLLSNLACESAFNTVEARAVIRKIVEKAPQLASYPERDPALHQVVYYEHLECSDAMVSALIAQREKTGKTPFDVMSKESTYGTILHVAAGNTDWNSLEGVQYMLKMFQLAEDPVAFLLEPGAKEEDEEECTDEEGDALTALQVALTRGAYLASDRLLKKASELGGEKLLVDLASYASRKGWNALHVACSRREACPEEILRTLAIDPMLSARTSTGLSTLHCAAMGDESHVATLLSCGADLTACDNDGNTALHAACTSGNSGSVKKLLDEGADPNALNNNKKSPLQLAAAGSHDDVCTYTHAHPYKPFSGPHTPTVRQSTR